MQPLALMTPMPSGDTASANAARTAGGNPQGGQGFSALVEGAVGGKGLAGPSPTQGEMTPGLDQTVDGTVMAGLMQALGLVTVPQAQGAVTLPGSTPGVATPQTGGDASVDAAAPVPGGVMAQMQIAQATGPQGQAQAATAPPLPAGPAGTEGAQLTADEVGAAALKLREAGAGAVPAPVGQEGPPAMAALAVTEAAASGTVPVPPSVTPGTPAPAPTGNGRGARPRFDAVNNSSPNQTQTAAAPVQARPAAFSLKGANEGMAVAGMPAEEAGSLSALPGGGSSAISDPSLAVTQAGQVLPGRDSAAAHAISAPRFAGAPLAPAQQLVARIDQAISNGQTTLTVHMDPDHLGRVEVKLEMKDGKVTALISAERPATLDMLQRDARLIERAMEQGGMQVQPDGLQFSLRDGGGGQWAEAGQGRRGTRLYGQQAEADPAINPLSPPSVASDSLVDIHI